jgi:hypothetical protein
MLKKYNFLFINIEYINGINIYTLNSHKIKIIFFMWNKNLLFV